MPRSPEPWKARVVSSVSADSDSAFQIVFGDAKYLFNCPENTTRAMLSRKFGFNKYKAIFLSRISSNTSAGLPGKSFGHFSGSHLID
jgi:ribonuclease Z